MSIAHDDIRALLSFGLPDRLGKALDASGVTSNEMADYLGVSRTTISNWINGRTTPKKQTLRLWAMRTGAPLQWLETGTFGDAPVGPAGVEPTTSTVVARRFGTVTPIHRAPSLPAHDHSRIAA